MAVTRFNTTWCKDDQYIVACMQRLYKTGIGLTTGFIGSHTITHSYSVYSSLKTAARPEYSLVNSVKVTLRSTTSRSVSLGFEPRLGS
jgi:hypothetical protein